jgi:hypothetical protein
MSLGSVSPFSPIATAALVVDTSSAVVRLASGGDSVLVTNTTSALAYVRFGSDPSVSASSVDMPIMANSQALLSVNTLVSFAAAILAAGSGTILFTRGEGSIV